jgi:hypothetical protein
VASDDSEVSDNTAERHLDDFICKVTHKRDLPLISGPPQQPPAKLALPRRSRRQAAHPLSQVPVSKRGEVLIKQRLGHIKGPTASAAAGLAAYDKIFGDGGGEDLPAEEAEALDELFPTVRSSRCKAAP